MEGAVERRHVPLAERVVELGGDVIAVAAAGTVVVRDVTRRLLEVGHEAPPLEHLGQDIGRPLARQVDAAELSDRVVAVLEEDALVELLGARTASVSKLGILAPRRAHDRPRGSLFSLPGRQELVEEETAQRLRRARVAREERALHDLGQVDEREDRAVEVGEVGGEGGAFLPCELVGHLEGDLSTSPTVRRPYAGRLESARDRYYYLAASRSRCAIPLTAERSTWHEAQVPARCRPDRRGVVVRRAGPERLYQARPALAVGTERSDRRDQPGDRRGDEGRGRRDPGGQGRSDVLPPRGRRATLRHPVHQDHPHGHVARTGSVVRREPADLHGGHLAQPEP